MTGEDFYLFLNELDDKWLAETDSVPPVAKKKVPYLRFVAVAACAAIIVTAVMLSLPYVQNMINPPVEQPQGEQSPQEEPPVEQPPVEEPPVETQQPDQEQPPSTDEKQPDQQEPPAVEELGPEACVSTTVHLKSIEQLVAFNKNPTILNLGDENTTNWMLSLHKEGNILSRDSIYVPTMPSQEYELFEIIQTPIQTAFVYYVKDAKTPEERDDLALWIYITYVDEDLVADMERDLEVSRDADGYVYTPRRMGYQLAEGCYIEVRPYSLNMGGFDYDTMRSFCKVETVNVNPDAVIK